MDLSNTTRRLVSAYVASLAPTSLFSSEHISAWWLHLHLQQDVDGIAFPLWGKLFLTRRTLYIYATKMHLTRLRESNSYCETPYLYNASSNEELVQFLRILFWVTIIHSELNLFLLSWLKKLSTLEINRV